MLTEKRQEQILRLVNQNGSVTVQELTEKFEASESTIRRDLNALHNMGALVKVFGGAIKNESIMQAKEERVESKIEKKKEEKQRIAQYAATLIEPEDFVYLDAGTTTGAMIPFLTERKATYVTNAVSHALHLAQRDFKVIVIGGEMKESTEAIVGNEAFNNLQKYNFTKGFFGTNGVDLNAGFTTPDISEALVKECAMKHARKVYVLCDSDKFYKISPVKFGEFEDAFLITDRIVDKAFANKDNIIVVE